MKRVIKAFQNFEEAVQEEVYELYLNGELERAKFPFKGELSEGVIFNDLVSESIFLIPIDTIKSSKLSTASDDDDDDDDDDKDVDDIDGPDDVENDIDDEE